METKSKLTIRRAVEVHKEIYRSNPTSKLRLQRALAFYEKQAGRPVSTTPVTRRAFELLDEHLATLRKKGEREDELARMLRNLV